MLSISRYSIYNTLLKFHCPLISIQSHQYSDSKWTIPDRLKDVPEAKNPSFFNMVEYYFHKACTISEDSLYEYYHKSKRMTDEDKRKKIHGILKIIEPCSSVFETNFPITRDDGNIEVNLEKKYIKIFTIIT